MRSDKLTVGIIVARGGGSSFYRKNAYPINGRPVLHWAIDILQRAGFVSEVFVWTEDAELAEITRKAGGVPLKRPRDMVHYFSGYHTLGEWNHLQRMQMEEHLGRQVDIHVPFNCNCIGFTPQSLRTMYETLLASPENVLRVQAVCQVQGGLCLINPQDQRLFPVWNNTELPLRANPPLYRMVGVGMVDYHRGQRAMAGTVYHEVTHREGFDFQHLDDIPFAQYFLRHAQTNREESRP